MVLSVHGVIRHNGIIMLARNNHEISSIIAKRYYDINENIIVTGFKVNVYIEIGYL